jgi:hypothetical protein
VTGMRFLSSPRGVAWRDWSAWLAACDAVVGLPTVGDASSAPQVAAARAQLDALALSGHGGLAITLTAQMLPVAVDLATCERATLPAARLAASMLLVRVVNGFADAQQTGMYAQSVMELAERMGLPRMLVDVRHEATHGILPSQAILRRCLDAAWRWLRDRYWLPQREAIAAAVFESSRPLAPPPAGAVTLASLTETVLHTLVHERQMRSGAAGGALATVPSLSSFTRAAFLAAATSHDGPTWGMLTRLATPALCTAIVHHCGAALCPRPLRGAAAGTPTPPATWLVASAMRPAGEADRLAAATGDLTAVDNGACTPTTVAADTGFAMLTQLAMRVHLAIPQPTRRWAWLRHSVVEPAVLAACDGELDRWVALSQVIALVACAMPSPLHHHAPVSPAVACVADVALRSCRPASAVHACSATPLALAAMAPLSSVVDSVASSAAARQFRKALAAGAAATGHAPPDGATALVVARACSSVVVSVAAAQGSTGSLLGRLLNCADHDGVPYPVPGSSAPTAPPVGVLLGGVARWHAELTRLCTLAEWAAAGSAASPVPAFPALVRACLDVAAPPRPVNLPLDAPAVSMVSRQAVAAVDEAVTAGDVPTAAAVDLSLDDVEAWLAAQASAPAPPAREPAAIPTTAVPPAHVPGDGARALGARAWVRLW